MRGKIINDPVYGFIRFPEEEVMQIIEHRWFQRLRNIKQMGLASLVYPGAVHTRFHHSLGATYLMGIALNELRGKGIDIDHTEYISARQAILLHDIGHGPFSHGLENCIVHNITHEEISRLIMMRLNDRFGGGLTKAISIFEHHHPKYFLKQLVSSQLDMDRLDYLNRDSFYTGVSEGVIGYDRILQMLSVKDDNLVIEEKGIHSVEKFIVARRLMYWQVYLHKTVLGADQLIVNILRRAKYLARKGYDLFATPALRFFLYEQIDKDDFLSRPEVLDKFCLLDDADIIAPAKVWADHGDKVLSQLCMMMLERKLYKVKLSTKPMEEAFENLKKKTLQAGYAGEEDIPYYLFYGSTSNSTYNQEDDKINILMKSGEVVNISQVNNALIHADLALPVQKYYMCVHPDLQELNQK